MATGHDMGIALQYTNIARDLAVDGKIGRVYLPPGWLKKESPVEMHITYRSECVDWTMWLHSHQYGFHRATQFSGTRMSILKTKIGLRTEQEAGCVGVSELSRLPCWWPDRR